MEVTSLFTSRNAPPVAFYQEESSRNFNKDKVSSILFRLSLHKLKYHELKEYECISTEEKSLRSHFILVLQ